MANAELLKYIKKGLDKGFSPEHIISVLKKHGHKDHDIRLSMTRVRLSHPTYFEEPSLRGLEGKSYVPMLYLAIVVLVIISVSAITYNLVVVQEKEAQIEMTAHTVKEKVSEINKLSERIDNKQKTIDEQLQDIDNLGLSIQDKEKMIDEQIMQLQEVNNMMKQERASVRSMLLELINSIMAK